MEKRGGVTKAKSISRWKKRYPITDKAMAEIYSGCNNTMFVDCRGLRRKLRK